MNTSIFRLYTVTACLLFAICAWTQSPCEQGEEYHQLDFWIGEWQVENPQGQLVGFNTIEKELNGCLVMENWKSNGPSLGKSMNYYDQSTKKWHQKWIDNAGNPLEFEGTAANNAITYIGQTIDAAAKSVVIQEMTLKKLSDDEVHQVWRQSMDGGNTWLVVFDGMYRRTASKN